MRIIFGSLMACGILLAQAPQAPNPAQRNVPEQTGAPVPIYRVTVVARTTKAINYNHRSGPTEIDFRGTALMPDARGQAKVESKQGVIRINAEWTTAAPEPVRPRIPDLCSVGHHARGPRDECRRSGTERRKELKSMPPRSCRALV